MGEQSEMYNNEYKNRCDELYKQLKIKEEENKELRNKLYELIEFHRQKEHEFRVLIFGGSKMEKNEQI